MAAISNLIIPTQLQSDHKEGLQRPQPGGSTNQRILRSTILIAAATLSARAVGLVREIAIAQHFGTSDEVDAYLIALLLPNFLVNILAGSLNAAFVPVFVNIREKQGPIAANRLLSGILFSTTTLLALLGLLLVALGSATLRSLAPNFNDGKLALALSLYRWLSPLVVLQGIISIWSSVLNADERFGVTSLLPVASALVAILIISWGADTVGIYSLAVGLVLGFVLQALILGWEMIRRGYSIKPKWFGWTPDLRQVLAQYLPMIAGALLLGSTNVVEQFVAASLPPGSVASLAYASRFIGVVNGVCAMALGTAVLPHFSSMVSRSDWVAIRRTLKVYRWTLFVCGAACAVVIASISTPLVRLMFHRGSFTEANVLTVSRLQQLYAIQVPFCAVGILLVRLISALRANKFLMWGSLISLVVNIVLNFQLTNRLGLNGVALTNSVMYVLSFTYLSFVVWRLLRSREADEPGQK